MNGSGIAPLRHVRTFLDLEEAERHGEGLGVLGVRHAGDGEDVAAVLVAGEHDGGRDRERQQRQHQEPAAAPHGAAAATPPRHLLVVARGAPPAATTTTRSIIQRRGATAREIDDDRKEGSNGHPRRGTIPLAASTDHPRARGTNG